MSDLNKRSILCDKCKEEGHLFCWAEHPAVGCRCCQATQRGIQAARKKPATIQPFPAR